MGRVAYYVLCCFLLAACGGHQPAADFVQQATPAVTTAANVSVPPPAPDTISALGVLQPRQTRTLSFQSGGLIRTIPAQIGARVRKGEQLATLDTAALALAQQDAQATVAIKQAQVTLIESNPQQTQPQWEIAQAELQQAQIALAQLTLQRDGAVIDAPYDGVISAIHAHAGEVANTGQAVLEVIDTQGWLVETNNVSELNISRIMLGQQATVKVIVLPDQPLQGQVIAIDPIAIVQQGDTTYTLYLELAPNDLPLLAGMNVEVTIAVDQPS